MATEDIHVNDTDHQNIHIFYGGLPGGMEGIAKEKSGF